MGPGDKHGLVDVGFVGEAIGVELDAVEAVIHEEVVPVISPLAHDESGHTLNVNADLAAGAIASGLKASKLIYLSDVLGIMRNVEERDSLIPTVNRDTVGRLLREKVIEGGMIPKVNSAVDAIESGVGKVHFIDGRIAHSLLLEIYTNSGVGTEIVP